MQMLGRIGGRRGVLSRPAWNRSRSAGVVDKLRLCMSLSAVVAVIMASAVLSSEPAGASTRATSAPVEIGIPVAGGLQALTETFGSTTITEPSESQEQADIQAVIDHIDAHGGLLGHKISPVYYSINAAGATTAAAVDQGMCVDFTQDHHVFAAMAETNHTDALNTCLEHADAVTFDAPGFIPFDNKDFATYPLYATAGTLSLTDLASVEVNGLYQEGFFGKGKAAANSKIGLLAYNSPSFTSTINQVLKPALARHGLKLADEEEVAPVESAADAIALQTPITNAALRFKSEGIDHVIFLETEGAIIYNWLAAEKAESYYPRLGVTTNDSVGTKSSPSCTNCGNVALSWAGGQGIGWDSGQDLATQGAPNATAVLCNKLFESAGASAALATQLWPDCDQLLVFQAAVNAGGQLTPKAAVAGLAKIKNFTPAELVGPLSYQGGHRDGVGYVRDMTWKSSCQCFQYTSPLIPVSSLENSG